MLRAHSVFSCSPEIECGVLPRGVGRAHICTGCAQLKPVCPGSEQNASPICNSAFLPALPRSLLHEFGNVPYLLVGLRDGTLVALFAFMKNRFQERRVSCLEVEAEQRCLESCNVNVISSRKTTAFKVGLVNRAFLRARGLTHRTYCSLCFDIVQIRCQNGTRSR